MASEAKQSSHAHLNCFVASLLAMATPAAAPIARWPKQGRWLPFRSESAYIGAMIDWSKCPDVEQAPGKVSGTPLIKGTRIPVQAVLDNAKYGYTPEQIAAEIYEGLPVDRARRVIAFARQHETHPA
jgi:uncharacterized protein (DUF433 family)